MFINKQSFIIGALALLLALANACPYLAREQDKQGNLKGPSKPKTNERRILQAASQPTDVDEAIFMATTQIQQIIADFEGMEAKLLRLAFHDCVGGCDGCVDLANPSNFGLDIPIEVLEPVVQFSKEFLTTGDVWALAGLVASRVSQMGTSAKFPLQFVGRPHCDGGATTSGPHRSMPGAHFTTKKVVDFFQREFGFSGDETVAILGAHSLGRATSANSGFTGEEGWDNHPDRLTNDYYRELLKFDQFELIFEQNANFPPFPDQFYWEEEKGGESGIFMLNADMALAFDMEGYLNPMNGNVTCSLIKSKGKTLCPTSSLRARTQAYAKDNNLWVRDFEAALLKIVSKGCENGVCTSTPIAVPVKPYCNWGPLGTAESSTCGGAVHGGSWCNAESKNCEKGCRGRWCTTVVQQSPTAPMNGGYCNWGQAGTGASSTCDGHKQGGGWCNMGSENCENGCGGRWCSA